MTKPIDYEMLLGEDEPEDRPERNFFDEGQPIKKTENLELRIENAES